MKGTTLESDNIAPRGGHISPAASWALAFGCAVGWGAFVMPGTTFLPMAGPLGTALGMSIGALVMGVIALNFHIMIQRHPDLGGPYAYVKELCNHDHAFLCGWFLLLTYSAIIWANATALALVGRALFADSFQSGFSFSIAGGKIWGGGLLLSTGALVAAGALLSWNKRWAARVQTALAFLMVLGAALALGAVLRKSGGGLAPLAPAFSPKGGSGMAQILGIVALAPWAFVGFEAVSHSAEGFRFSRRCIFWIMAAALGAAAFVYAALAAVAAAAAARPAGFPDWPSHLAALENLEGLDRLPVFHAVEETLGRPGLLLLAASGFAAAFTGLLGLLTAASRLLVAMARDNLFPPSLAVLNRGESPARAIWVLVAIACLTTLAMRAGLDWIVEVATVGASIAYGYVSLCVFLGARRGGHPAGIATGLAGIAVSVAFAAFFLVPELLSVDAFSIGSYIILAVWAVLGALHFRHLLVRDASGHLGKSTVVWLALLFLVFFSSHMWVRQATYHVADNVVVEVGTHYAAEAAGGAPAPDDPYLVCEEHRIEGALNRYHLAQMALVVFALGVMASIYAAIARRERDAAKAKEYFFSTVSHDIRTPLNAIVGYTESLRLAPASGTERAEALDSILSSSRTLLRIVDDILDLSRLEAGDFHLDPVPTDCTSAIRDIAAAFEPAAREAGLDYRVHVPPMPRLLLDPVRMRQMVFNLVGNAVKYTEKGHIEVRAAFTPLATLGEGDLLLEIEDTGIGIAEEDIPRITTAYVQVGAKLARNGGTGLGLAICRHLATAIGGTFHVQSAIGRGTTITLAFPHIKTAAGSEVAAAPVAAPAPETPLPEILVPAAPPASAEPASLAPPPGGLPAAGRVGELPAPAAPAPRILLVDDSKMNLMVLKALLKRLGTFDIATAADGNEALALLRDASAPPFALVLTDYWMPNLDGAGLVDAVRADPRLASLPVHVVTADVELQASYAAKGFDGILLKPVTPDVLRPLLPTA